MNHRLRPDYLSPFLKVACLIFRADPPPWLAEQLWRWNRWLYRDRRVEEMRPTREQMRSTLLQVEKAANLLAEALAPSSIRAPCFWVYAYPAFLMYAAHSSGGYCARILAQASEIAS